MIPSTEPIALEKLLDLAGQQAEMVCLKLQHTLNPTWVMGSSDGKMAILITPWGDDVEKRLTERLVRKLMREREVVAYSVVSEVWIGKGKPGKPYVPARLQPDRREGVVAVASNGKEALYRSWIIKRDSDKKVVALELQPAWPEGKTESWMEEMLSHV
jgi:hypothetical protein